VEDIFMKWAFHYLAITLATLFCTITQAQEINMGNARISSGFTSWDQGQNRLIRFNNVNDPQLPAAQTFSSSGETSAPIFALKDIPGAQWLSVWDVAAMPGGNIAISGIAGYAKQGVAGSTKPLILTYDSSGRLKAFWNVYPYHQHKLVANASGEIFALGDKLEANAEDFPMLTKYSADGHILWQSLSTSLLHNKDKEGTIQGSNQFGESKIVVHNDEVFVWLPRTEELFHFSKDGNPVEHTSMGSALRKFATRYGFSSARLDQMAFTSDGALLAQFTLWPYSNQLTKAGFALARMAQDGSAIRLIGSTTTTRVPGTLLGVTNDDKIVFQERAAGGKTLLYRAHDLSDLGEPATAH
jgi:hypothetical protein